MEQHVGYRVGVVERERERKSEREREKRLGWEWTNSEANAHLDLPEKQSDVTLCGVCFVDHMARTA